MDNLVFIEDPGVNRLLDRLKKGMLLKSRIVLELDNNRYLLRIQGRNLIMQSKLNFNRSEELWIEVQEAKPKLKLRLVKKEKRTNRNNGTNLVI